MRGRGVEGEKKESTLSLVFSFLACLLFTFSGGGSRVLLFFRGGIERDTLCSRRFQGRFPSLFRLRARITHPRPSERWCGNHGGAALARRERQMGGGTKCGKASHVEPTAHPLRVPPFSLSLSFFPLLFSIQFQEPTVHRSRPVRSTAGKVSRSGEKNKKLRGKQEKPSRRHAQSTSSFRPHLFPLVTKPQKNPTTKKHIVSAPAAAVTTTISTGGITAHGPLPPWDRTASPRGGGGRGGGGEGVTTTTAATTFLKTTTTTPTMTGEEEDEEEEEAAGSKGAAAPAAAASSRPRRRG